MHADTRTVRFSEQILRQVQSDCARAMRRARFDPAQGEIVHTRCVDNRHETEQSFGSQLWYFEGLGVDDDAHRHRVFGVIEYSVQYGLLELIEDGVFDSEHQRERFRLLYEREMQPSSWRHPAHRLLALGLIAVSSIWLGYLVLRAMIA